MLNNVLLMAEMRIIYLSKYLAYRGEAGLEEYLEKKTVTIKVRILLRAFK